MTEDDRKAAMKWLDGMVGLYRDADGFSPAKIIKAMLAEPRMPHPDELTEHELYAMWEAKAGEGMKCSAMLAAYRRLYDLRTKPPEPPLDARRTPPALYALLNREVKP